jgi:hypothetical protein
MNKAEFYILADTPQNLDKNTLSDLKSVVKDFPYFQAAQVLLLKNLHSLNHYEYDAVLKRTAVSVPSRLHLFGFIHDTELSTQQQLQVAPTALDIEDIVIHEEATTTPLSKSEVVVAIFEKEPASSETIEEEPLVAESQTIGTIPTPVVVKEEETIEVEAPVTEPMEETVEETISSPAIEELQNTTLSFTEWLKLSQTGNFLVSKNTSENKTVENTILSTEEKTITEGIVSVSKTKEEVAELVNKLEKPESNIGQFESILDKFIRENPRMSRPKAEFYNPANMAKQSVQEDEEIATETLAKVYMAQGHHKKAIRVYEKLCLIYPHRITYFADLIQKIKNEHK